MIVPNAADFVILHTLLQVGYDGYGAIDEWINSLDATRFIEKLEAGLSVTSCLEFRVAGVAHVRDNCRWSDVASRPCV